MRRLEADTVVAGVCRTEREAPTRGALLGNDTMIGTEDFVNRNEDAEFRVGDVVVERWVVLFDVIFTCLWG